MNLIKRLTPFLSLVFVCSPVNVQAKDAVFKESGGLVAVEAEHFAQQTETDKRAFYLTTADKQPSVTPDGDPSHIAGASGGAYLEILPDTRRTHADPLIKGTNFAPEPGKMAVVHYQVHFSTAGRYYVWVRAYSTGSEDNGLHVGIDGTWPASGQRLQWCQGKNTWRWESKQRTKAEHCGEPHKIYLDVDTAGVHTIHFSMREDGFEFDKWLMTTDRDFARPDGAGPAAKLHSGQMPALRDAVPAATTLARAPSASMTDALVLPAKTFPVEGSGYYLDKGKWLAINPAQRKSGKTGQTFPFPTGLYDITLQAVGENDGKSTYRVQVDDETVGDFECPLSDQMFEEGESFGRTWEKVQITEGSIISVASTIGSSDGMEFSRARWTAIAFRPADAQTREAATPFLAKQSAVKPAADAIQGSPTKPVSDLPWIEPRQADGTGDITLTGELKQWHKVTLTLSGPYAHEQDNRPNPFTDYRMSVTFTHDDGSTYELPGYFAADGNAANSSAESGTSWRAHFAPDRVGRWSYRVAFHTGEAVAFGGAASGSALAPYHGKSGTFTVAASDKQSPDLRARGRLQVVGKHYLQFAGSREYFLKAGADAPETLLGYADFDNTHAGRPKKVPLKTWSPHVQDWREGDPTWKGQRGKGLIGAINYLSSKGCNAFSFLTYNAGGDGDNVWPFIHRDDKLHYDCSKLDQWGIVFDHGTARGMYLHFKMQENEIDDNRSGSKKTAELVPESLDGGQLGIQRKLYCRELVARFGHNLALNWNLGEENTQSTAEQQDMINAIAELDAYDHNIVIHTFPEQQDQVYRPLLGNKSALTGVSLQNSNIRDTHRHTVKWVRASDDAGKPWIVAFDESGTAAHGQCPDLGYRGYDGRDRTGKMTYTEHEVRKYTLWGHLMGGGAGVEYYFGYQYAENDLVCEDWRSRDRSWDYCRIAIEFFREHSIPFWQMTPQDELVGNTRGDNSKYCFAASNEVYLVYLPDGGTSELDLSAATGDFAVHWFNPRSGGELLVGSVKEVSGGQKVTLGKAPVGGDQDWLVVVRRP